MTVCTFDNPATMSRECWQDGRLICSYSMELLTSKQPIPGNQFFFGANIGPWDTGQYVGDLNAMRKPKP